MGKSPVPTLDSIQPSGTAAAMTAAWVVPVAAFGRRELEWIDEGPEVQPGSTCDDRRDLPPVEIVERKGLGHPYPARHIVRTAMEMGIPFCFGDDSHGPAQVGAGIADARSTGPQADPPVVTAVDARPALVVSPSRVPWWRWCSREPGPPGD